jgi:phosphatidylserine decarboxylase
MCSLDAVIESLSKKRAEQTYVFCDIKNVAKSPKVKIKSLQLWQHLSNFQELYYRDLTAGVTDLEHG